MKGYKLSRGFSGKETRHKKQAKSYRVSQGLMSETAGVIPYLYPWRTGKPPAGGVGGAPAATARLDYVGDKGEVEELVGLLTAGGDEEWPDFEVDGVDGHARGDQSSW
jgi:hypothetical protein